MKTSDLRTKMELWGMTNTENRIGEVDRTEGKIKDLWCKIILKHGKTSKIGNTEVEEVEMSVTIRCRKLSIKDPSIDMFFKKNGVKYEVIDFLEDFKTNDFWEFMCKVIYE